MNLPDTIKFHQDSMIVYQYDANGTKLRKRVLRGSGSISTDYVGGYVYEDDTLEFISIENGKLIPQQQGSGFDPHYFIRDHLGNVRVMFTSIDDSAQIVQENHYYPFGMKMGGLSYIAQENKLLYQGKELQEDYKLNWYDFGARMYDNQIGRWHMVDPVNQNRSPYVAMGNNPLTMIDPNGMYFKPGRRTNYLIYTRQVLERRKKPTGLMYLPEEPEQLIWDDGGGNSAAKMRQAQIIKAWAEERYETLTAKEAPKDKPFKLQFADVDDLLEEIGVLEAMQPGMMHYIKDNIQDEEQASSGGATNISQAGLDFIARFERFSSTVYKVDGKGNPTIGYGHEVLPGENFSNGITRQQGLQLFGQDAQIAVNAINRHVTTPLSQHQFDALTSYVFNTGSLYGTNLLINLNSGNFQGAALQMDINTSGGVYMQGLQNRRIAEQNLFLYGY